MTRKQRLCQPCQRKHRLHKANTSLLHSSPALHVSSSHQAKIAMGGLHPNSGGINELSSHDLRGSQHKAARLTTLYIKQTYLFGLHLEHHWKLVPPCWAWRWPTTIYNQHPVVPLCLWYPTAPYTLARLPPSPFCRAVHAWQLHTLSDEASQQLLFSWQVHSWAMKTGALHPTPRTAPQLKQLQDHRTGCSELHVPARPPACGTAGKDLLAGLEELLDIFLLLISLNWSRYWAQQADLQY